ncbi:hypothetical protein E1B28_008109 [Marasmius oreades]|uniref:Uncharacterized protein n=1 Tax=Marasmius oreades TaxID=181124 RepID=A0A9P7RZ81_9AGAR|nr:uncharacterized protein E1B28_008109 [Marasmius oreades]KAG7091708.1 hypothetical protein E1B28_008109 [Marasmius oreades]
MPEANKKALYQWFNSQIWSTNENEVTAEVEPDSEIGTVIAGWAAASDEHDDAGSDGGDWNIDGGSGSGSGNDGGSS